MKHLFWLWIGLLYSCMIYAQSPVPFQLGETHTVSSAILSENRTLHIYLPPEYHLNDTTRYPVIYLLDGSKDEDFIHVVGLVQFANFSWINALPPSIVVGIANVDRKRDFTFPTTVEKDKQDFPTTGGSAAFMAFLEQELQPYINKQFRTNDRRSLIGQSLGGLLATEIAASKPALFTDYFIISPSLWWNKGSLLQKITKAKKGTLSFAPDTHIYVAVGNEGRKMEKPAKKLAQTLQKHKNTSVRFAFFPQETHATILHSALYNGFFPKR